METIREKLNFDRLMLAATIVMTIGYAWLLTSMTGPRFDIPESVASNVVWIENGKAKDMKAVYAHRMRQVTRVQWVLQHLENRIGSIGGFTSPPLVIITADEKERYAITDSRIEISESIARVDGQLLKAFMKVWILQRAGHEFSSSLLRLEVTSDVLTAMLANSDAFEIPNTKRTVHFPKLDSWLLFASSYEGSCHSPWSSLELRGKCGQSLQMNSLSFRSLLGSMIWSVYQEAPGLDRQRIIEAFAEHLRDTDLESQPIERPTHLLGWRDWVLKEYRLLFPIKEIASELTFVSRAIENKAELSTNSALKVDVAFHKGENVETGDMAQMFSRPTVVSNSNGGGWLLPGNVEIGLEDLAVTSANLIVWQSCKTALTGEVMRHPVSSPRILYVESCDATKAWPTLARDGFRGFAKKLPSTPFVQLHREMTEFAVKKGQFALNEPISRYMKKSDDGRVSLLGLNAPEWRKDLRAYKVLGAIEAVEWFRALPETPSNGS